MENATDSATIQNELEQLIYAHERSLLTYVSRLLRDRERAQDVVQEVFLRYLTQPLTYGETRQRTSWLFRVAHNLSIDLLRKESRHAELQQRIAPPDSVPGTEEQLAADETRERLERLLSHLNPNQRRVMVLFFQEGLAYREIAEQTGLSISNVGMLLHRGLKKLRTIVDQEGPIEAS